MDGKVWGVKANRNSVEVWRCALLVVGLAFVLTGCANGLFGRQSPDPARADPVILAAGDIANCKSPGDEATAKLVERVRGTVLTLGDNAYPSGKASNFADCYNPTWGKFKSRTRPSLGNHEYGNRLGTVPYFDYFGRAAGPRAKGYYSYNLGAWHIVVLNANCDRKGFGGCGRGSPQERWLRADLEAHPAACVLAYWHQPRFSSGEHGDDTSVAAFWQDLYVAGADVVLNGHDHDYERFAPQNPIGKPDPKKGIREFVVGTGGAEHRSFHDVQPNSEVRAANVWGVLKMTLHKTSYDWKFLPIAGQSFTDSGSASCTTSGRARRGILSGVVKNARTGAPVEGAAVRYDGGTRTTDASGRFTISDIASGPHSFTVNAEGMRRRTISVNVTSGGVVRQVIAMSPSTSSPVFTDRFEYGNLSEWTSSDGLTVERRTVHSGLYAVEGTTTAGHTYAKKELPSQYRTGYARIYFRVLEQKNQIGLLRFRTKDDKSIVHLYLTKSGRLGLENDITGDSVTSSTTAGRGWHELELQVSIKGTESTTGVWLDGAKVGHLSIRTNLGTDLIGGIQIGEVEQSGTYSVAFDDVTFAVSRISEPVSQAAPGPASAASTGSRQT